jgi:hypothetical protein
MKEKGKRISCPRCNTEGLLILKQTKSKGKTYHYYAVAHSKQSAISEFGKRVHRIKWCYLNRGDIEKLRKMTIVDCESVTQKSYTNVTQNCVTPNNLDSPVSPRNVVDGAGFEPAASAMPTLRSYQTDLPAQS